MKRILATVLLVIALLITGCGAKKLPDGVIKEDSGDWYIVKMPEGADIDHYFTISGAIGYMHGTNLGQMDRIESMGGANYARVEECGWVIYSDDLFLHIPYQITDGEAKMACATLILNEENYMTLEEAKEYIDFLK